VASITTTIQRCLTSFLSVSHTLLKYLIFERTRYEVEFGNKIFFSDAYFPQTSVSERGSKIYPYGRSYDVQDVVMPFSKLL